MPIIKEVLVTGSSGFLGWHLTRLLQERDHSPILTQHRTQLSFTDLKVHDVDLTSTEEVQQLVDATRPSIVIHCAALTKVDVCENDPELAELCNVSATQNLLNALQGKARFIYLSTDLVFDGLQGDYREADEVNPISVYSRSKLAGENAVRYLAPDHVIVRAALVYGPDAPRRPCFLSWMHKGCRQGQVTLFTDEYRTSIYVIDLADLLIKIMNNSFVGDLHAGGAERLSRYEFGLKFCQVFDYPANTLVKKMLSEVELLSYRPPDVSLNIERARSLFNFKPLNVAEGLKRTSLFQ